MSILFGTKDIKDKSSKRVTGRKGVEGLSSLDVEQMMWGLTSQWVQFFHSFVKGFVHDWDCPNSIWKAILQGCRYPALLASTATRGALSRDEQVPENFRYVIMLLLDANTFKSGCWKARRMQKGYQPHPSETGDGRLPL